MSKFTELKNWCEELPQGAIYRTTEEVCWEIGAKGSGLNFDVPKGYIFDVSIPLLLRWILSPRDEKFLKAGCLHDYALHEKGWDRVSAGALFASALKAEGVNKYKRLAMVISVIVWKWR